MANSILESYKARLNVAESYYMNNHNGDKMDSEKKLATAQCLKNLDGFLGEAFDNSTGTQRADLGA